MEVKERQGKYYPIQYYEDPEPRFLIFRHGDRVLPAPFWNDKKTLFTFVHQWDPGEHRWYPTGGFELRGPNGEFRSFDLDQVILHPSIFETIKRVEKIRKRQDKDEVKKQKYLDKIERKLSKNTGSTGKRGRPKLSDEEKLKRSLIALDPTISVEIKTKGRKRLAPEQRIIREAEKLARKILTGGKRGRPAGDPAIKEQREKERLIRFQKSGGKRGRPPKK